MRLAVAGKLVQVQPRIQVHAFHDDRLAIRQALHSAPSFRAPSKKPPLRTLYVCEPIQRLFLLIMQQWYRQSMPHKSSTPSACSDHCLSICLAGMTVMSSEWSCLGKAAVQAFAHDTALAQVLPHNVWALQVCPLPKGYRLQRPLVCHAHELQRRSTLVSGASGNLSGTSCTDSNTYSAADDTQGKEMCRMQTLNDPRAPLVSAYLIKRISLQDIGHVQAGRQLLRQ